MYQPTLGRFLSRDPLSANGVFVAGGAGFYAARAEVMNARPWHYGGNREHPYVYAKNNPVLYVDPSGLLTVKPLRSKLKADCGQEVWIEWDFVLDQDAPCHGYFVQQVDVRCTVKGCPSPCPDSSPTEPDFSYWEAFFVRQGDKLEITRVFGESTFTDRASLQTVDKASGVSSQIGKIKFFCMTTTGDLGAEGYATPGSGWNLNAQYGNSFCETSAGILPSTGNKPNWWDNEPIESATRWVSVMWNCCRPGNRSEADAGPK